MSRCKCCDTPLTGVVRYKHGEEFDGLYIEEDLCTQCIYISDNSEYINTKTYLFEDLTESLYTFINKA